MNVRVTGPINVSDVPRDKTFITLLTEGGARNGAATPTFEQLGTDGAVSCFSHLAMSHSQTAQTKFCVRVTLRTVDPRLSGCQFKAYGGNKKAAKHKAAKMMLDEIVRVCDDFYTWGIPGHTKEEARRFLDGLMPDLDGDEHAASPNTSQQDDIGPDLSVNAVGQLSQFCNRYSMPMPVYDEREARASQADNNTIFVIELSVGSAVTVGEGRSKKLAKHQAARSMYEHLINVQRAMREEGLIEQAIDKQREEDEAEQLRNDLHHFRMKTDDDETAMAPGVSIDGFDDDDSDTNTPSVSAVVRVKAMKLDPFGDDKIPHATGYFFGLLKELCDEEPMFKNFDECKDAVMVVETNDAASNVLLRIEYSQFGEAAIKTHKRLAPLPLTTFGTGMTQTQAVDDAARMLLVMIRQLVYNIAPVMSSLPTLAGTDEHSSRVQQDEAA